MALTDEYKDSCVLLVCYRPLASSKHKPALCSSRDTPFLANYVRVRPLLRQRSRSRISARRRRSRTKPRKEQGLARSTAARDTVAQAKAL